MYIYNTLLQNKAFTVCDMYIYPRSVYEYDMTMTEFLYDLLSKQITNPLFEDIFSGGELSSPSFVRLKDQEGIA